MQKETITKILHALEKAYPYKEKPWLKKADPFRTVVVTALSAHTTDASVDKISPALFAKYPTPEKLSRAKISDVEKIIKPVGLYHAKAKNIIGAAKIIVSEFGGKVPATREQLVKLPGVGRKTANVVLIKCFGTPAMPVDTHVFRVARRIGFSKAKTPEKVELDLLKIIPEQDLGAAHFWLIVHGRITCHARNPNCNECPASKWCEFFSSSAPKSLR